MSFSMYNIENVSIRFLIFSSIDFVILKKKCIFLVGRWFWVIIFDFLFDMFNELAIFVLLFCNENHRQDVHIGEFC